MKKQMLLAFFICATLCAYAQTDQNTWYTRPAIKLATPLLVINGKPFAGLKPSNYYMDSSFVRSIHFISPGNDSAKSYGPAGAEGVMLVETKKDIEWVSTLDMYDDLVTSKTVKYREVLFALNAVYFIPAPYLFMDKSMVLETTIQNDAVYFADKWFSSVISISMSK